MLQIPPKLIGLSEILEFFRQNETPFYCISPTAYNLLGIDRWVGNFEYINYYDSFDGQHSRVFVPQEKAPRDFGSIKEVSNCLLGHKEIFDRIRRRGPASKLIFVMFDRETEELARDLGVEIALPSAALRTWIDSKIVTTRLGNEAGVASVPNVLGRANSYAKLHALATAAGLRLTPAGAIAIDDALTTSDPHVYAIGDCAGHPGAQDSTSSTLKLR